MVQAEGSAPVEEGKGDIRSVLKNRPFLLLWLAQAVSQTAQNGVFYALMVFLEEATSSTLHMSLLILSTILPSVVLGVIAGVVVDRTSKKGVLVSTNLLRGIVVLGYLFLRGNVILLYVVNLTFSIISQFFAPAEIATIPLLVKRRQLIAANGLFNLTFTGAQLAGFVIITPPLVKLIGTQAFFWLVCIGYWVCAALVSFLPSDQVRSKRLSLLRVATLFGVLGEELRDGWRLLRGDPSLSFSMVYLTLTGTLMLVMGMLAPGYANRVLHIRTDDAVYVLAPAGVGIILGVLLLPVLVERASKERLIHLGLWATGLSLLGLAGAPRGWHLWGARVGVRVEVFTVDLFSLVGTVMVLALVLGLAFSLVNVSAQTVLQERAPVEMRGRVFATQLVFGNVASVVPLLFIGVLADLVGIPRVILVVAGTVLLVATLSTWAMRPRVFGRTDPAQDAS